MKKILISILGVFFGLIAFVSAGYVGPSYKIGPVLSIYSGSVINNYYGYNLDIGYSENYYYGKAFQFYGFGNYLNYYDGSFQFSESGRLTLDSNSYLLGFNNGFYQQSSGLLSFETIFKGGLFTNSLATNSRAYPDWSNLSRFVVGTEGTNIRSLSFVPEYQACFNGCSHSSFGVFNLIFNNSQFSSSSNSYDEDYFFYNADKNYFLTLDQNKIYSNYGSFPDVPSGYVRKKFFINGDSIYSFIYGTGNTFKFASVYNTGVLMLGGDFSDFVVAPDYGTFLFHIFDYSSGNLNAGNSTFILSLSGNQVVYNAYSLYTNSLSDLKDLMSIRKGILSGDFNGFVNSNGLYFEIFGSYVGGVTFRVYNGKNFGTYTDYKFHFVEDDSVSSYPPFDGCIGGGCLTTGDEVSQLISNICKGPTYNTPDGLPPSFCFNQDGTLITSGLYLDIGVNSSGEIEYTIKGQDDSFINSTSWHQDENGNRVGVCTGDCNGSYIWYESGTDFWSTGYFNNYLNNTGNFFKCPYPYSEKLTIGKRLITSFNGFDIFLPINCFIASFQQGKNINFLSDVGFDQNNIHWLMGTITGSDDPRNYLYTFFDFILALGLFFLLNKIYHYFR